MSALDVRLASTPSEREAAYRLRYDVYVEELRRLGHRADHATRQLVDELDPRSHVLLASLDGEPVGTMRLTWGGDGPFPEAVVETFGLDGFAEVVPASRLAVGTRFAVRADLRGGEVPFRLLEASAQFGLERGVEVAFCDCMPHLIGMYLRLGFRSYRRTFNDPEDGLMVPLALVVRDGAYLERVRSPLRAVSLDALPPTEATAAAVALMPARPPVRSVALQGGYDWADEVKGSEDERRHALRLFDGLTDDELSAALAQSHIIDVEPGQMLIRRGQVTRTMYLVLGGELEVRDGERLVRTLGPGDSVGEIAFLLRRPRTLDVAVGAEGAKLLSLHEPTLRELLETRSHAAAVLLLNLATKLAERLATVGDAVR